MQTTMKIGTATIERNTMPMTAPVIMSEMEKARSAAREAHNTVMAIPSVANENRNRRVR